MLYQINTNRRILGGMNRNIYKFFINKYNIFFIKKIEK